MKKILLIAALFALCLLVLTSTVQGANLMDVKDVGVTAEKGQWMECASMNFGTHQPGTFGGTGRPSRVSSTDAWTLTIQANTDFLTADGLYSMPVSNLSMSGSQVTIASSVGIASGGPGENMEPDVPWELYIPWDLPDAAYGQPMTAVVTYTLMPAL